MKRIKSIFTIAILLSALFTYNGCSSSPVGGTNLLSTLTSTLGLSSTQALGGAGALLSLAQSNLGSNFDQIAELIPGVDSYLNIAKTVGGLTGNEKTLGDLSGTFDKLGLSTDQVGQLVPAVSGFLSAKGGSGVGDMFSGIIK